MSTGAEQAQAWVRYWEAQQRDHRRHCGTCSDRHRCRTGYTLEDSAAIARGHLRHLEQLGQAPVTGQLTLW